MMGCGAIVDGTWELMKGTMVLAAATMYRIVTFMIFLSASIGPSVLICRLYNYATGFDPMPNVVESAICMVLVSYWAEFSVGFEKKIFGNIMDDYKNNYPNTMSFGRFTIHFLLYVVAYGSLYDQFEAAHTIPVAKSTESRRHTYDVDMDNDGVFESNVILRDTDAEAVKNQEIHTAQFLLALAYLVFITSRNFHKDVLGVVGNLAVASFSILSNCTVRLGFAIIHLFLNFLYFLPCLAIAYTSRSYKTPGSTTYFQLSLTAGLSGMVASLFELNRPWPQQRGRIPCLFYENNLIAKNMLAHALVVLILIAFYRPFNHEKVLSTKFDSTNEDVIFFSMSVAFTILHVVKCAVHSILVQAQEFDVNRLERLELDMQDMVVVGADNNNLAHNQGALHSGSGRGDAEELCARCAANALNNNDTYASSSLRQPNVENDNSGKFGRTCQNQNRSAVERVCEGEVSPTKKSELATILEEGEKLILQEIVESKDKQESPGTNNNPISQSLTNNDTDLDLKGLDQEEIIVTQAQNELKPNQSEHGNNEHP